MQRATGSIPYTSLMWNRKYYECGDFLMEVPANVYDPSWAYIYTEERPETGIIQKVEYSDTSQVAGGVDTVILSGFFFEWELNRYTFLVEETEEEAYRIYKPAPAKTVMPTLWQDADGNLVQRYKHTFGSAIYTDMNGEVLDESKIDISKMTEVSIEVGGGATKEAVYYPPDVTGEEGEWVETGRVSVKSWQYYSEDGETLVSVNVSGEEAEYEIVGKGLCNGDVVYKDEDGSYRWINGVASNKYDTYVREVDSWQLKVKTEGLEVLYDQGEGWYAKAYRTIKGPWQLRTDLDINEPADNVQRIIQWAQDIWGNNILYDEPGFTGRENIINPSLKLFGDMAYEELKTVEASPRFFYSFANDTCVFEVWRGLDRTQSQAGLPEPDEPVEPEPEEPTIDDLYEAVDYIESDGTQYIDTGVAPNQDTRVVLDCQVLGGHTSNGHLCSVVESGYYFALFYNYSTEVFATRFGTNAIQSFGTAISPSDRNVIDKNGNVTTIGDSSITSTDTTFQMGSSLYLCARNNAGTADNFCRMRIYPTEIYADGSTLVRNLVPMRRKSDGVFGMLDLVNEVFYESATEYAFTGPSYPVGTYEELEYVVAAGENAYIDTGMAADYDLTMTLQFCESGKRILMGNSTKQGWYFGVNANGVYELGSTTVTTVSGLVKQTINAVANSSEIALTVGGETITRTRPNSVTDTLKLGGGLSGYDGTVRIWGFSFAGGGDFVPKRRIADGAVGLLDLTTETFYESAGSVAFLAPGELPSGYTQLEYIESTGSQYIDTGFTPNGNTRVVLDFQLIGTASTQCLFGARTTATSKTYCFWSYSGALRSDYCDSFDQTLAVSDLYAQMSVDKNAETTTVGGLTESYDHADFECAYPLFLLALNNAGTVKYCSTAAVWAGCVYDAGTLVRDYVPAMDSSGEAGLFDLVTMSFYADASGTGFVASPEVAAVASVAETASYAVATVSETETTEEAANPFAVFSDTWGTLYGFTASKDVSNYRNTCHVLYQFRDATDEDGNQIGPRGYVTARIRDDKPDIETYLDLRGEEPSDETQTDEAFIESLRQRGLAHLQANYAIIENLDTGTLVQDGYLSGFDLGDKVDMLVEAVGLVKEARITGCCEIHEAGSSTVSLEIGEQKLTDIRKAVIV